MSLEVIDTSFWLTKDKAWMQARKDKWPSIEVMLSEKTKKALNIIKQYYLKGKMPNWQALQEWENNDRHLDLFCFLWLHPSDDETLLYSLYREYMTSELIYETDAIAGYYTFLRSLIQDACARFLSMDDYYSPYLEGKGLTLFNVLYKDIDFAGVQMRKQLKSVERFQREAQHLLSANGYQDLFTFGKWLCLEVFLPGHEEFLLQYDEPFEWWYLSCKNDAENFFNDKSQGYDTRKMIRYGGYKALYNIYHFDTKKEGDTCRTRFVLKIRKALDEREFSDDFKQMWLDIKAGKIDVEDPWEW